MSEHEMYSPHQRALILVADDEQTILLLLREILIDEGFIVEQACNGHEALLAAQVHPPTLVITDLMMPVMDGRTLASKLRHQPETATVPILLISAGYHPQPNDTFTAVLSKPFSINTLLEAIYALLR